MKVRITILTENDEPLPPIEKRPAEEQLVKAWQVIFDVVTLFVFGKDKVVVEKAEYVEEQVQKGESMSRLIDADAMIDDVLRQNETIKALGIEELTKMSLTICDGIKQEICNQPTIDAVEVVHGKWYTELFDGDKKYQCSNCLTHWDVETRYCPFCGAKMDGKENRNEE